MHNMNIDSVQKMKNTETLVLTKGQLFWHYCIIPFLLIVPLITTIDLLKSYVTHNYRGLPIEISSWSFLFLLPAIAFYMIQKRRLKFKVIDVTVNADKFMRIAEEIAKKNKWNIVNQKSNLIVAKSGFSWRSWGELITIIRDTDRILFNSICDPDNKPSVASWGKNKINLRTFIAAITA